MRITPRELQKMAVAGSFRVEPILNSIAAAEGEPLRVAGFTLHGPRRNRTVLFLDADGLVDVAPVTLWLDCIDYATAKMRRA